MQRQKMSMTKFRLRMTNHVSQDLLHGVTLKTLLVYLVEEIGWDALSRQITLNCFTNDPSITSSLKFLRKTPWARKKVEQLYVDTTRHALN